MQEVSEIVALVQKLRLQVQEAKLDQQSKRTRNAVLHAARLKQEAEIQKVSERCFVLKERCQDIETNTLSVDARQVLAPMFGKLQCENTCMSDWSAVRCFKHTYT
jgi:hypothetical protein